MTTRMPRIAAGSVLVLALAGCGSEAVDNGASTPAPTSTSSSATSSATTTAPVSQQTSPASDSSTTTSTGTTPATDQPTTATSSSSGTTEPAPSTRTILLNPKAADGSVAPGWTATPIANPCNSTVATPSASAFAIGNGVFSCGPTAANLLACWNFPANKVGCIQGTEQLGRKLVIFTSTLTYSGAAEPNPAPIAVELTDGTVCSNVSHDSGQHWQGRHGWLSCTDGRMLLAKGDGTTSGYFDKSAGLWTAQAVQQQGTAAPTKVSVASATYARGA